MVEEISTTQPGQLFSGPGGLTSQTVDFPVFDDVVDEAPEGFIIVLDADEPLTPSSQVLFTRNLRTTLGRINDDDHKK